MRILVVGAGGIGGYFGGRLLAAGRDVTFLVRARRAAALARTGLVIKSPLGDATVPAPPTIAAEALREPADLVLLSCKAFDLEGALDSVAPAIGPQTAILPLLNGMRHLDVLKARFGAGAILGGQCLISTVLDPDGRILHLNESHLLSFGELDGTRSSRVQAIAAAFDGGGFDAKLSTAVLQEMWEKWVFIASVAAITCLMRAPIGDIVAAGAADLAAAVFAECAAIAAQQGYPPSAAFLARGRGTVTSPGSLLTASMFRDIQQGAPTEGDHVISDLLRRGTAGSSPLLRIADAHLRSYEARRAREAARPGA